MGTAALSDARSVLSIAISHNMDNVDPIKNTDLQKYMGLDANGMDASGSKIMKVDPQNGHITYGYRRGGVELIADIDVSSQKITWTYVGLTQNDTTRIEALAQGLKLAQTADLTTGTTAFT